MKTQHKILAVLIILIISPFSIKAQDSSSLIEKAKSIEKVTAAFRKEYNVPAITIGFISGDEVRFINQGHFDRSKAKAIDENSIFQIASVSKVFVGIIINSLVLEGKLHRSESITAYLPTDYDAKTLSKLQKVTIRDLLHHRSGLPGDSRILRKKTKRK